MPPSGYRAVWLFVMFDLPVKSKAEKREYVHFRKHLLSRGFTMFQFSVYGRFFGNEESSTATKNKIRTEIPDNGQVRLLTVTDKQFGKMEVFFGKIKRSAEKEPSQLLLF